MPKFRLLHGNHCENERDPNTNELVKYKAGDIFFSPQPLDKMHNSPGSIKFEPVSDGTLVTRHPVAKAATAGFNGEPEKIEADSISNTSQPMFSTAELERMNVEELKKFAAEEEIDLGTASKKADIIARIQSAVPA